MVPPISNPTWREIVVGTKKVTSTKFGFNLLLTNTRLYFQKDGSEAGIAKLIQEMHIFLSRYEGLYQVELKEIFSGDYIALLSR